MTSLKLYLEKGRLEAGCDEAGRGCLAGPVTAAAVILNPKKRIKGLNDSKQLSEIKRKILAEEIKDKALAWAVAFVEPSEIDRINILQASILAMNQAVNMLTPQPDFLLIDGNRFRSMYAIPFQTVIKGDALFQSIAAASILAKTERDLHMEEMHLKYPIYQWDKNKGYPTKDHRMAIMQHGVCPLHRKSFRKTDPQLKLFK